MVELILTIANICKEIQRIQFDIEHEHYNSAIDRCQNLDELISEIEAGRVNLSGFNPKEN